MPAPGCRRSRSTACASRSATLWPDYAGAADDTSRSRSISTGWSRPEEAEHDDARPRSCHDHAARSSASDAARRGRSGSAIISAMEIAVRELLIEKGVVTAEEIRRQIEDMDAPRRPAQGARVVARAWTDPAFKERLLADGTRRLPGARHRDGADPAWSSSRTRPAVHNLVVCTLCSCYPRAVLGLPPDWYKSRAYRARAVREPRAVLAEFGTELPEDVAVRVHDSHRRHALSRAARAPAGTRGLTRPSWPPW